MANECYHEIRYASFTNDDCLENLAAFIILKLYLALQIIFMKLFLRPMSHVCFM